MEFLRSSGVLLHPSSLASNGGIGDLGPAAHDFVHFLAAARQHIWQVLPLSPTGYGNSPYAASSAFAGNPNLISLEILADWGWIAHDRIANLPGPTPNADFDWVDFTKLPLLREAAASFLDCAPPDSARAPHDPRLAAQWAAFESFCSAESSWLVDYAYYAVLRRQFNTGAWTTWPEPLRRRRPEALAQFAHEHGHALAVEQVLQFAFAQQWNALRETAARSAIRILGDVAIFVNMDSADVWVHPELFELDADLQPIRVAGVPPDYFSATGQRWGNPLYRWDVLEADGFNWWIARIRRACALYDIVRLDHFRGFEAYWAIPAEEATAVKGEWIKAPGLDLFQALEAELGPLPLVAEDLGLITPQVEALRAGLGLPTMRVMQFGFSDKGAHPHLPHQYTPGTVAYTGTHDNDTTQGWWHTLGKAERDAVEAYVGPVNHHPVWPLIRALFASVAEMAIVPAQDHLELESAARMNTPAVPSGNWSWRAPIGCFTPALAERLAALVAITDREYDPLGEADPNNDSPFEPANGG
jgi:4-alpha-glucanotransferase